jgi:hypothetical protein
MLSAAHALRATEFAYWRRGSMLSVIAEPKTATGMALRLKLEV